jgi:hypothetical protein
MKKLAAALILTVVVAVATCSVYGLLANTPSPQNAENAQNNSNTSTNPQSWMTKGAYATYEGISKHLILTNQLQSKNGSCRYKPNPRTNINLHKHVNALRLNRKTLPQPGLIYQT